MRKIIDWILLKTLPGIGLALLYILGVSVRKQVVKGHRASPGQKRQGIIYALWHENLLMHSFFYRDMGIVIQVSASRDGEYATRAAQRLGFETIRGSASRGGQSALRKMIRALNEGKAVAMTPDGPRGPRRESKLGPIYLAKLSGAPIIPIACGASRCWRPQSWDRHLIPKPFSRLIFAGGKEITVDKNAGKVDQEKKRAELERELRRVAECVDGCFE